ASSACNRPSESWNTRAFAEARSGTSRTRFGTGNAAPVGANAAGGGALLASAGDRRSPGRTPNRSSSSRSRQPTRGELEPASPGAGNEAGTGNEAGSMANTSASSTRTTTCFRFFDTAGPRSAHRRNAASTNHAGRRAPAPKIDVGYNDVRKSLGPASPAQDPHPKICKLCTTPRRGVTGGHASTPLLSSP